MFFEEKKINDILDCSKCGERLDEPKILPCGDNVCSSCVSTICVNNNKFECIVCNEQYVMPEKGLPTSKKLSALSALQPTEVSRGKSVESLKHKLKEIKNKLSSLIFGAQNGIDFIKGYCSNLKNDAQLAAEKLIEQINDCNDDFIKEINEYEKNCIQSYSDIDQETKDKFVNMANELDEFHTQ